jgi:hypothetical protein
MFPNQSLGRLINAPFHSSECGRSIEDILPVMHIQNGIAFSRQPAVPGRQVNPHIAPVPEDLGRKSAMPPDVSGKSVFRHAERDASLKMKIAQASGPPIWPDSSRGELAI